MIDSISFFTIYTEIEKSSLIFFFSLSFYYEQEFILYVIIIFNVNRNITNQLYEAKSDDD